MQKKKEVYCRYLMPRKLRRFTGEHGRGVIEEDPYRPELRNLFLERNDGLINNFEEHLLLANMGNIDWRPLLNLWAVLEYLTKYTAKAGKGSKHLGRLFEDVLDKVAQFEMEEWYARPLAPNDHEILQQDLGGSRLLSF